MGVLNTLATVSQDMWRGSSSSDLEDLLGGFTSSTAAGAVQANMIWGIISLILALVGGILIYFLFVKKKTNPANKFLNWMKSFLKFDKILIEDILKVTYIVLALLITLNSLGMITYGPLGFLGCLFGVVLGNLLLRVAYEFAMITIMIWSNTTKIKNQMTGEDKVKESKK